MSSAVRFLAGLLLVGAGAHADPKSPPSLDWLHDLLAKSSRMEIPATDDGPRQVISTNTDGKFADGAFILQYVCESYRADDSTALDSRQLIMYRVRPESLDPNSVAITTLRQPDESLRWIVVANILEGADYIPYDNIFESQTEEGKPDLTRSRGRVRQVALGYFTDRATADALLKKFADYLRAVHTPPDVKRPGQSAA